jgi:hypothetical protein
MSSKRAVGTQLNPVAELPDRIAAWVERVAPDEPGYCLAILYSADASSFVPASGLGTDSERRDWIDKFEPADRRSMLWNPAEYRLFDPEPAELMRDDNLAAALELVAQESRATLDQAQPRKLLTAAAKTLAQRGFEGLRKTEPFTVLAVDDELADLERCLRALVPNDDLVRLENRS